jgi:hypothetical protein
MAQMLAHRLTELDAAADVMLRGYVVRSKLPLLGRPLAWLRRNLTSHLREPYVDPTFERQVAFNRQVVSIIGQVAELLSACVQELDAASRERKQAQQRAADQLTHSEAELEVISTQLSLLESADSASGDSAAVSGLRRTVDALREDLALLANNTGDAELREDVTDS